MEFTDHHVGRVLDSINRLGILENTLVYYIIGDNGASAEGQLNGTVRWVQIEIGDENADHLVHPEDRLRIIMARQ